jgi:hypothetical protein
MPASRHAFSKCGHKGYGADCHRCALADKLDALAKTGKNKRKKSYGHDWDDVVLQTEVLRLRGPQRS